MALMEAEGISEAWSVNEREIAVQLRLKNGEWIDCTAMARSGVPGTFALTHYNKSGARYLICSCISSGAVVVYRNSSPFDRPARLELNGRSVRLAILRSHSESVEIVIRSASREKRVHRFERCAGSC